MTESKVQEPLLDIEDVLLILNKISIFAGMSQKQLFELFRLLKKVSFDKGEIIFEKGDKPTHIYVIERGKVKLFVQENDEYYELIEMQEGKCFGESSVIGIQPHAATAIAMERTELIVLSREALLSLYKTDSELFTLLVWNIAREVSRRLHESDEIILHYFKKKAHD